MHEGAPSSGSWLNKPTSTTVPAGAQHLQLEQTPPSDWPLEL